jgi:hypothetical protein
VTFAPGETSHTITVQILPDYIAELTENFYVNLSNPTNATIADEQDIGTILDNDAVPVFSIDDVTVTEGVDPTITFTVTKTGLTLQESSVDYDVATNSALLGDDYSADSPLNGTLTFAAGETFKTITLNITDDTVYELNEDFNVNLSGAVGATIPAIDGVGTGTIIDNDVAPTIETSSINVSEEGLLHGIPDASGTIDTTDLATRSGTIAITGNGTAPLTAGLSLDGLPTTYTSGGESITWSYYVANNVVNHVIILGVAGGDTIIQITLNDGDTVVNLAGVDPGSSLDYEVALLGPVDHQGINVEDTLSFNVGVTLSNGFNPVDSGTIDITIEDDMPTLNVRDGFIADQSGGMLTGTLASMGADGGFSDAGAITWNSVVSEINNVSETLTSLGNPVTITASGNLVTGTTGAGTIADPFVPVFTITGKADGTYTVHLDQQIDSSQLFPMDDTLLANGDGPEPGYNLYSGSGDTLLAFGETAPAGATLLATFTGTGGTGAHADQINMSSKGIGVGGNTMSAGDIIHIDLNDDQHFSAVKVSVTQGDQGDVSYIAYYTNGDNSGEIEATLTGTGQDFFIQAEEGTYLDWVDILHYDETANTFKIDGLNFFNLDVNRVPSLDLTFTAMDGDGDTVNGSLTVTFDPSADSVTGDGGNNALGGGSGVNTIVGGVGDDILTGGAGADTIDAGAGDDAIVFDAADNTVGDTVTVNVDGGVGFDTLLVADTSGGLNFSNVENVEKIDLNANEAQEVTLSLDDVLDMTTTTDPIHVLEITGGTDDVVTLTGVDSGDWAFSGGGLFTNGVDQVMIVNSTDPDNEVHITTDGRDIDI